MKAGLPLQAYAWMHQYAIVTSVWPYHSRVIERTGKIMAQTSRWGRLAFHNLNFEKKLFHTDGQHQQIVPMQTRYGDRIRIESFTEEHLFTLESLDATLPVDSVIREFGLTEYQPFLDALREGAGGEPGKSARAGGVDALAEPLFELKDIAKSFPGVRALDGVSFDLRAGRGACAARRERRRQVDAGQDHLRHLPARRRHDPARRPAGRRSPDPTRGAGARHQPGAPGAASRAVSERRREHLPRPAAGGPVRPDRLRVA